MAKSKVIVFDEEFPAWDLAVGEGAGDPNCQTDWLYQTSTTQSLTWKRISRISIALETALPRLTPSPL